MATVLSESGRRYFGDSTLGREEFRFGLLREAVVLHLAIRGGNTLVPSAKNRNVDFVEVARSTEGEEGPVLRLHASGDWTSRAGKYDNILGALPMNGVIEHYALLFDPGLEVELLPLIPDAMSTLDEDGVHAIEGAEVDELKKIHDTVIAPALDRYIQANTPRLLAELNFGLHRALEDVFGIVPDKWN